MLFKRVAEDQASAEEAKALFTPSSPLLTPSSHPLHICFTPSSAPPPQVLLKQVAEDQASAEEVKGRVKTEEADVAVISKEAGEIAADAQRDLDEAMPAFHSAVNALKSLNKSDVQVSTVVY